MVSVLNRYLLITKAMPFELWFVGSVLFIMCICLLNLVVSSVTWSGCKCVSCRVIMSILFTLMWCQMRRHFSIRVRLVPPRPLMLRVATFRRGNCFLSTVLAVFSVVGGGGVSGISVSEGGKSSGSDSW